MAAKHHNSTTTTLKQQPPNNYNCNSNSSRCRHRKATTVLMTKVLAWLVPKVWAMSRSWEYRGGLSKLRDRLLLRKMTRSGACKVGQETAQIQNLQPCRKVVLQQRPMHKPWVFTLIAGSPKDQWAVTLIKLRLLM